MGASEWMGRGKDPNALRAKGVEKEEEEVQFDRLEIGVMDITDIR
jgi:hypothetical protein